MIPSPKKLPTEALAQGGILVVAYDHLMQKGSNTCIEIGKVVECLSKGKENNVF